MRLLIATLAVMFFAAPAIADDEGKKIDIMNPYKEQQQKVVERSTATNKQYRDDWFEHVEERYGGKIEKPADDAYVTSVTPAKSANASDDDDKNDDKDDDRDDTSDDTSKPDSDDDTDN